MTFELKVPKVGESITEVEIGDWLKAEGDAVDQDETLVMIDSAKTTLELPSPVSGILTKILKKSGDTASIGEVIAHLEEGSSSGAKKSAPAKKEAAPAKEEMSERPATAESESTSQFVMPSAQRILSQKDIDSKNVAGTGPGGRVIKADALQSMEPSSAPTPAQTPETRDDEEVVHMSMLRRQIAKRLLEAQQNAALLTTFNEIDMSAVITLRKEHQDVFLKHHNIKLGFMSFFVKAAIDGLKHYPAVNAEIQGDNIIYKNHYDIGVAIGTGKGLVVPVIRDAQRLSFAEIEQSIADFAARIKANKLNPDELSGGTFSITNGGIFGSLLSTPIVNPPQSGILGMHSIQERPIAVNGEVVIRPMMYVAVTYDHRVVDGREAVSFLVRIKECIENPARMLIEA
ncbi:MAG: 2-oxoglutarate dehydrogenase complex dihydrolipoyllysine-residue succinyltransferase [Abditibacteriaceae bacterium]